MERYVDAMPNYSLAKCHEDYCYALLWRLCMEIPQIVELPPEKRILQPVVDVQLRRLCAAILDNNAHELP